MKQDETNPMKAKQTNPRHPVLRDANTIYLPRKPKRPLHKQEAPKRGLLTEVQVKRARRIEGVNGQTGMVWRKREW